MRAISLLECRSCCLCSTINKMGILWYLLQTFHGHFNSKASRRIIAAYVIQNTLCIPALLHIMVQILLLVRKCYKMIHDSV